MSKQTVLQLGRGASGYNIADNCARISLKSGIIAAAQPANSCFFTIRPAPTPAFTPPVPPTFWGLVGITRVRLQYTTLTAFTTPVTAGRSLAIGPSQSGAPTVGTQLSQAFFKGAGSGTDPLAAAVGGNVWISTTAPLDVTPQAAQPRLAELSLTAFGTAGATVDKTWDFGCDDTDPIMLGGATQARYAQLVLFNPTVMDAAGTFEFVIELDVVQFPRTYPLP